MRLLWGIGGGVALAILIAVGYRLTRPVPPSAAPVRTTARPAPGHSATAAATVPTPPTRAPAFQVTSLNAGPVRVPAGRPTVVYFMSAACGSCYAGEQQLAQVAAHMPASVQWLSLDVEPGYDTPSAVLSMAQTVGARWPQAFATPAILQEYHIAVLDMVAVIGQHGALLYDGPLPATARLEALIHQAGA